MKKIDRFLLQILHLGKRYDENVWSDQWELLYDILYQTYEERTVWVTIEGSKSSVSIWYVSGLIIILVVIGIDLKVGISLLGTFVSNFSMQTHLHIASTTNATDVVFYETIFLLQCCVKSVRTQATSLISISF